MKRVWFVVGNPLRGDDGIAHQVAALLDLSGCPVHPVHQLTPELAADFEDADEAVFLDADVTSREVVITPVEEDLSGSKPGWSTHQFQPADLVSLARTYYGFKGRAFVCHIPAPDLSVRVGLSPGAMAHCRHALTALVHSGFASSIL